MNIKDLLSEGRILLDLTADAKEDVWKALTNKMYEDGIVEDVEAYLKDVAEREKQGTTGVGFGVAIPHAKSEAVKSAGLAMARTAQGIDVASLDGTKADIFFLIAAPKDADKVYLQALSKLARLLMHENFRESLRNAKSPRDVLDVIEKQEEQMS
ncbi:PTS sugar transporter subunit IIA [Acetomicrobium hydrogeniformans]|uniref:PTS sugar transporter subunit IIA n=1 Tax=Acetomicrobium hydrogeniformans TaxID=649746 RepID=A0A7V6ZDU4_9BACT|nr:PTS sugar transporter subunit IIA [Acetomicrobium hydrogeniformans]HHZ04135.1 PTS sugar transporter subunit IIA [Acetomicrobium hydrogeniformans]